VGQTHTLKAIETVYNGYRFRSRLEARWAVFFQTVGIKWDYEIEGFELPNGVRYLPDFWLSDLNTWLEIKPQEPSELEKLNVRMLRRNGNRAGIVIGTPYAHPRSFFGIEDAEYCVLFDEKEPDEPNGSRLIFVECRRCRTIYLEYRATHIEKYEAAEMVGWGCPNPSCDCEHPGMPYSDRLSEAYQAARQARFEYGEVPGGVFA